METRKIQKTGGASFIITLPKQWIRDFSLRDKDYIVVSSQKTGSLILQPLSQRRKSSKTVFDINGLDNDELVREIIALYISGAELIEIKKSPKISSGKRAIIRQSIQFLMGYEIIEESANHILIKNIFDPRKFSIQENLEKIFFITKSMFECAIKALAKRDKNLALEIIERDAEVDKLHLLITRGLCALLQDKLSEEDLCLQRHDLLFFRDISYHLERIADNAVKLARLVQVEEIRLEKSLIKFYEKTSHEILSSLEELCQLIKNPDRKKAHQIIDAHSKTSKINFYHHTPVMQSKEPLAILVGDSLDNLRRLVKNIADVIIDYSVVKESQF